MDNIEKSYKEIVVKIIDDIKNTQKSIFAGANKNLLDLYYRIGEYIDNNAVYGNKFIDNLSMDIKLNFPNSKGFSARNLHNMHKYYKICKLDSILQTASAKLPWSHNMLIFDKIEDNNIRLWYINETAKAGWSYDTLAMQIKTDVYSRQVINEKVNNYELVLPENTGKIANELMKDPYILNLTSLDADFIERELENKMVEQIKTVLIELGTGFSFVGSEYKVTLSDKDYYIDLLFYHTILHCYVAVELKNTEFKPEYIGKMNFYLTALDEKVKSDKDESSIGLILCRDKDRLTVEYALKDVNKPIGVSSYEIQKYLPKELSINLPSEEDINIHLDFNHFESD